MVCYVFALISCEVTRRNALNQCSLHRTLFLLLMNTSVLFLMPYIVSFCRSKLYLNSFRFIRTVFECFIQVLYIRLGSARCV
jgi:hypothetical protein